MDDGFKFVDIILFAAIAAFLVLRLKSVLGRRDGHEGGYHDPFKAPSENNDNPRDEAPDNVVSLPDRSAEPAEDFAVEDAEPESPLDAGLTQIRRADSGFNPADMVNGGHIAFEMILGAFAAGDEETLQPLLSRDVFANFSQSIRDREKAGETVEDTLVAIKTVEIVEAYLEGPTANVTIKFVSDQINVTYDEDGGTIEGDSNQIIAVTDFWTFARDTRSRDPNWVLVATRSLD
jgi:predicted lipid-binding transport protein (Tim44 family)